MPQQPSDLPKDDPRPSAVSDPSPPADWVEVSDTESSTAGPVTIPVLPVRDVVVFPGTVTPLIFGRERSLRALRRARSEDALGLLVAQRDPDEDDPTPDELYPVGTVSRCLQALELPDGTVRAVFEGMTRAHINDVLETEPFMKAEITPVAEVRPDPAPWVEALKRRALEDFEEATELSRRIPPEALVTALNIDELGQLADIITSCLDLDLESRQALLEEWAHPDHFRGNPGAPGQVHGGHGHRNRLGLDHHHLFGRGLPLHPLVEEPGAGRRDDQ